MAVRPAVEGGRGRGRAAWASVLLAALGTLIALPAYGTPTSSAFATCTAGWRGLHRATGGRDRSLVSAAATEGGARYKALTRIRLREGPDVSSKPTGELIEKGEVVEAAETVAAGEDGIGYLTVAGRRGWIFDHGIAGAWVDKPILEAVSATASPAPAAAAPAAAAAAAAAPAAAAAAAAPAAEVAHPSVAAAARPPPARAPPVEAIEVEFSQPAGQTTAAAPATSSGDPAVALAMAQVETLLLPSSMLGAGFELVRLEVKGGRQMLNFLLYNAFPENALTAKGQEAAGKSSNVEFTGGWLGAAKEAATKVDLEGVTFVGSGAVVDDLKDVSLLDYTLPQEQLLGQLGVELHGVLGRPFFDLYDMDLDRYGNRASFYAPGQAASQGFYSTVKHLPGISLPSGNLGVVVKSKAKPQGDEMEGEEVFFIGLVDTGAAHTVLNWEAAKLLGYTGPEDPQLVQATKVLGASDKGTADEMPVVQARLSLSGVPEGVKPMMSAVSKEQWDSDGGDGWYFDKLGGGSGSLELGAVNVAIGNVLGLSVLRDSKIGPFVGAAAIVGQDLLFQAQRVVLDSSSHQLWLEPGDVKDAPEM